MNNYNYGGYPYGNFYQPFASQPQQQNQQPQTNQYAFVNGIEGAKSYQLVPNQTILLMDSDNPIVYMKQSNGMGQASLKYYKLIEISEQDIRSVNSGPQDGQDYAFKSDIADLNKRLDELSKLIEKPVKGE